MQGREVNPTRNIFTYAKVDTYRHGNAIELTTPQGKSVKLNFGISSSKKQTWLTIKAKQSGSFGKTFNQATFRLVLKDEQFETEETVGLTWTDTNTDFSVECAKFFKEIYDVPRNKRVTCTNQVNTARRTIFTPHLRLDIAADQIINDDIAVYVSLVRSGKSYGILAEVKKNGFLINAKVKVGTVEWNIFKVVPLAISYSNKGSVYSLECGEYSIGDELPDKDLKLNCESNFEPYWKPVAIANGARFSYIFGGQPRAHMWVSKGENGYTLILIMRLSLKRFKYKEYDLKDSGEELELASGGFESSFYGSNFNCINRSIK